MPGSETRTAGTIKRPGTIRHHAEIPRVEQVQVMLLWPPIMASRSWDEGFFGPRIEAMPAKVTLERELSAEESRAWLGRLGITPGEAGAKREATGKLLAAEVAVEPAVRKKPWWRFW